MSLPSYKIFIPTIGRINNQRTYNSLPDSLLSKVTLVTNNYEIDELSLLYPAINCPLNGIAQTRQWLLDSVDFDVIIMIDDDFRWRQRKDMSSMEATAMVTASPETIHWGIERLVEIVADGEVPMAGISHSFGNHLWKDPVEYNKRLYSNYAINVKKFRELKIKFDDVTLMEDFYVILQLLTKGYRNAVLTQVMWDQVASNSEGGCSTYRTPSLQEKASYELARHFPEFVKVVEKKTKSSWFPSGVRHDCNIQWKKAYEYGKQVRALL